MLHVQFTSIDLSENTNEKLANLGSDFLRFSVTDIQMYMEGRGGGRRRAPRKSLKNL